MRGCSFIIFFIGVSILIIFFYYVTLLYAYFCSKRGRNILFRDFYECGFKMISDTRCSIDIQFSVIGFIFLIYDIEIIILVPLIVNMWSLPYISCLLFFSIVIILIFSYYYE